MPADAHVVAHAEVGDEAEILMHERETLIVQRARRDGGADAPPVDEYIAAGIRAVDPADQLDKGRLARAILADERVHLARLDLQVGLVEHCDAGEGLGEVAHLEARLGHDHTSLWIVARGGIRDHPSYLSY